MPVRTISINESLDRVREELLYTRSALLTQKPANTYAESLKPLLAKSLEIKNAQTILWDNETEAQAKVAACNFVLDELVQDVSEAKVREIRSVNPGWRDREARESHEYNLYFTQSPSALARLAAESQAEQMKPWITLLKKETSPELLEMVPRLEEAIAVTDAAVKERDEAASVTAVHRVRSIEVFIGEVNEFRTRLYASLLTVSQDNRLPKSWGDIFFRPTPPSTPTDVNLPGMLNALLTLFTTKGLKPTDEQLKKIIKIKDSKILEQSFIRACTTGSIDEVLTVAE